MKTTTELIAKEGWKPLIIALFGLLLSVLLNWNFLVLCVFGLLCYVWRISIVI